nr:MAG TPA_asm: hypothetical protein [Caudoviricetes sp.]
MAGVLSSGVDVKMKKRFRREARYFQKVNVRPA